LDLIVAESARSTEGAGVGATAVDCVVVVLLAPWPINL
jgi:hypothetical protein